MRTRLADVECGKRAFAHVLVSTVTYSNMSPVAPSERSLSATGWKCLCWIAGDGQQEAEEAGGRGTYVVYCGSHGGRVMGETRGKRGGAESGQMAGPLVKTEPLEGVREKGCR